MMSTMFKVVMTFALMTALSEGVSGSDPESLCYYYVDIGIVFDFSEDVSNTTFERMKQVIKNTLELTSDLPTYTRVGIMSSSPRVKVHATFSQYRTLGEYLQVIDDLEMPSGSANMLDVLHTLYYELYSTDFQAGNRVFSPNIAFILTDGASVIAAGNNLFEGSALVIPSSPRGYIDTETTQSPVSFNVTMNVVNITTDYNQEPGESQNPPSGEKKRRKRQTSDDDPTPKGDGNSTAETPTKDSETQPGDSETPGGDSETPGGDSETPGGDSETQPGDSETQPGDSEIPGGDSETPGGDSETPGGDSETQPGDSETQSGDSESPGGDSETPGGDSETPGGDSETPRGDSETPRGDSETPAGDSDTPPSGESDSKERESITRVVFYTKGGETTSWRFKNLASQSTYARRINSELRSQDLLGIIKKHAKEICPGKTPTPPPPPPTPNPEVPATIVPTESSEAPDRTCSMVRCYGDSPCSDVEDQSSVLLCSCGKDINAKYCHQNVPTLRPALNDSESSATILEQLVCLDLSRTTHTPFDSNPCPAWYGASLDYLCPKYGPESGGTNIFIWGRGLEKVKKVNLGPLQCNIIFSNATVIQCSTPSVKSRNILGSVLSMEVQLDGCSIVKRSVYSYRKDPIITNIEPTQVIQSGGQVLTVTGNYFDSVSVIIMTITAKTEGYAQKIFPSTCEKKTPKSITCATPKMDVSSLTRGRRSLAGDNARSHRWSRQALEGITFSVGFKMDGLDSYTDLSEALPQYGQLQVSPDPTVQDFEGDEQIKVLRPNWPDHQKEIIIKGNNLVDILESHHYTVMIGRSLCRDVNVTSSEITCLPPSKEPRDLDTPAHPAGTLVVTVSFGNVVSIPGYLRYDLSPWGNKGFRAGILAFIVIFLCILFLCILIYVFRRGRKKPKKKGKAVTIDVEKNQYLVGEYLDPGVDMISALEDSLRQQVNKCILDAGQVQEEEVIRKGSIGVLYSGWMLDAKGHHMMKLTIKTFKDKGAQFRQIQNMLESVMILREIEHRNVLKVVGIAVRRNLPRVSYCHMEHHTLKAYLLWMKRRKQDANLKELLNLCHDVCEGMVHLANQGVVHEDIATRNCWVDKDLVVKIGDSALSRDMYENEYYQPGEKLRPLPLKWMAPETFESLFFSSKSDVWSFGVLLWEVLTVGQTPYAEVDNADVKSHIKSGNRLAKPDIAPVSLYTLMTHCWAKEPRKRPHFTHISKTISDFLEGEYTVGISYHNAAYSKDLYETIPQLDSQSLNGYVQQDQLAADSEDEASPSEETKLTEEQRKRAELTTSL